MMTFKGYLCYFACLWMILIISSCRRNSTDAREILTKLEQIVEQKPDSVLLILDSIIDPYILNKEDNNKFLLLQIQAKDKSYKDISSDTLLFQVKDYYLKRKYNQLDDEVAAKSLSQSLSTCNSHLHNIMDTVDF